MTMPAARSGDIRAMTMKDILSLVVASAVSSVVIRSFWPRVGTAFEVFTAIAFCAPAGLAALGPWMIHRQFRGGRREQLTAGEALWLGIAALWIAFVPALVFWGSAINVAWDRSRDKDGNYSLTPEVNSAYASPTLMAWLIGGVLLVAGLIALLQSVPPRVPMRGDVRPRPWSHWMGIGLAISHAAPHAVVVVAFSMTLVRVVFR